MFVQKNEGWRVVVRDDSSDVPLDIYFIRGRRRGVAVRSRIMVRNRFTTKEPSPEKEAFARAMAEEIFSRNGRRK